VLGCKWTKRWGYGFGSILVVLLVIVSPLAQAEVVSSAPNLTKEPLPVTLTGTWIFATSGEIDSLPGLWLGGSSANALGKHPFALVWLPELEAFWPTWKLVLASDTGFISENMPHSYVIPTWPGSVGIELGKVKPINGHVYEPMLSYDPANGALLLV
jgi:hypothetical protein